MDELFETTFHRVRQVSFGNQTYYRFYKENDINLKDSKHFYIDLDLGLFNIFNVNASQLRITKAKELLDYLNAPF